jgi:ATP-dependent DNA helicase PIF1
MTINKAQGQSIKYVGLYLPDPVFIHGQLYVGLSRVTSSENIRVYAPEKGGLDSVILFTSL